MPDFSPQSHFCQHSVESTSLSSSNTNPIPVTIPSTSPIEHEITKNLEKSETPPSVERKRKTRRILFFEEHQEVNNECHTFNSNDANNINNGDYHDKNGNNNNNSDIANIQKNIDKKSGTRGDIKKHREVNEKEFQNIVVHDRNDVIKEDEEIFNFKVTPQSPPVQSTSSSPYSCRYIPSRFSSDLQNGYLSPPPPKIKIRSSNLQGRYAHVQKTSPNHSSPTSQSGLAPVQSLAEMDILMSSHTHDPFDGNSNNHTTESEVHSICGQQSENLYDYLLRQELGINSSPSGMFRFTNSNYSQHARLSLSSHIDGKKSQNVLQTLSPSVLTPSKTTFSSLKPFENSFFGNCGCHVNLFDCSPSCPCFCHLCRLHGGFQRRISPNPIKILDAPYLQDDFYLNLVDWGVNNQLAVGLGECVYLWNADTSKVAKLASFEDEDITVTSVSWMPVGTILAIGCSNGLIKLYDVNKFKCIRSVGGHSGRVGCLSWNGSNQISSGSRDRMILHRDTRSSDYYVSKLIAHNQEVCGLKWCPNGKQLASGGNDNKLFVWQPGHHSTSSSYTSPTSLYRNHIASTSQGPLLRFSDHLAAVKAISWSPHQHGLLASGGGTADRCIRFFDTLSGVSLHHVDTGSQVCNLMFSETSPELVSTHGYSQNQIVIWSYPSMTSVATLTGHTYRVLYLSMSPDGQTIVTGAGDETLRLWNVFPSSLNNGSSTSMQSSPINMNIR